MPKVIPFGNRILVNRRKIGEKVGSIVMPDFTSDRPTDLADVTDVPDLTFSDKDILDNAEMMIKSLIKKVKEGDSEALNALLQLNQFVKIKSIKVGDAVMISKYVGVDYYEKGSSEYKTLVNCDDIIGLVVDDEKK